MWMKVDDGLHAHRKTRAVTKSHPSKGRDAAPMGLWVLAGSWAALHGTDGWVPEDELDRWDDDWRDLVRRLVQAGYWWPSQRDNESGYGFTDWHDYNDPAGAASKAGSYGNHVRWHANEGRVMPECEHCPTEPDDTSDIAPESGGESGQASPPIALPEPVPDPIPEPEPSTTSSDESANRPDITTDRFEEFWDTYGHKVDRRAAEQKWRLALKKPDVTADRLIASADAYVTEERANNEGGRFIMGPAKWLLNERWRDERKALPPPRSRVSEHLALVQKLAQAEGQPNPAQIEGRR